LVDDLTIKSESRLKTQVEEISQLVREHDALNKDAIAMLSDQSDRVKKTDCRRQGYIINLRGTETKSW
jgi:hypothetical protein